MSGVRLKTYRGIREPLCHVRVLSDAAAAHPAAPALSTLPPASFDPAHEYELTVPRELMAQSIVPFNWGIDGSGTHCLAVALLADLLGPADRVGIRAALPFMRVFLSRLPKDDFEISETIFRAILSALRASAAPRALPVAKNGASVDPLLATPPASPQTAPPAAL